MAPPDDPVDEPVDRSGAAAVRAAYDDVAGLYATHLPDTRAEAPLDLAALDAFVEAVTAGGDPEVLDAGCGAGRIGRHLADRGCTVEGVDLSPGMVAEARSAHPDLRFTVGSLTDLPFPAGRFAGVLLWYSTIHTPPAGQARVFSEAARVLRPGGHVLVGFQSGRGTRDVSAAYRRYGREVRLERHLFTPDEVARHLRRAGLHERARVVRRPRGAESDDQAFLLARLDVPG
ncbi:class I SAM-dependent DNA methyltransferase [Kineococcus gypseus]|uniref:class I SAM-dependent DNA methyltransferase n=1 Tax=Kineococcus gypseus TaxID=1637102 RepID=UPI003D7EFE5D